MVSIVMGIGFILKMKWAHRVMLYLSSGLILGICGYGIITSIYGFMEYNKFKHLSSVVELFFGFVIIFSGIPFLFVIAYINNKEFKAHYYQH